MSCMRNILLTLSYDGTDFCGWQRQDHSAGSVRTVQAELEKAIEKIHKAHTVLYGSGRTDSGVHAVGQAANFFSPVDSIPAANYVMALNAPHCCRMMSGLCRHRKLRLILIPALMLPAACTAILYSAGLCRPLQ